VLASTAVEAWDYEGLAINREVHMKRLSVVLAASVTLALLLAGCNLPSQSGGPASWIDQPLDGSRLPVAPVVLQAHAADADGAATIEFYIDDGLLASVPAGGSRLGEASFQWTPPGPGTYTVSVRAADSSGNLGSPEMIEIVVGEQPSASATPTPAPAAGTPSITPSESPAPAPSLSPKSTGPLLLVAQNANCRLGPGTQFAVVEAISADTSVTIEGRDQDSQWFWVRRRIGSGHCWVSASVGSASGKWQSVPVLATPALPATLTPAPAPADTTPPSIENVSIGPTYVQQQGCGGQETFVISATVTDASGVGNVTYEVLGPTPMDQGDGYLLPVGGDSYQQTVGPIGGTTGTWSITLHSVDMAGNSIEVGPWTIQLVCIQ
jgi:hypothetical protein